MTTALPPRSSAPFSVLATSTLPNRIVDGCWTRNRAEPETDAPHDLHALYYRQREAPAC